MGGDGYVCSGPGYVTKQSDLRIPTVRTVVIPVIRSHIFLSEQHAPEAAEGEIIPDEEGHRGPGRLISNQGFHCAQG